MNVNLGAIKTMVTSKAGLKLLAAQNHSPAVLFGVGVAGVVGTVVLASRATLKVESVLDDFQDKKFLADKLKDESPEKYSENDHKQDMVLLHTRMVWGIAKLYAPAVGLGVLSIAALGGSHVILTRRNASLMAAYATIDKAFKEYRGRVIADAGEDKDREYRFGTAEREVYSEKKNGEPVVKRVKTYEGHSQYARLFNESNKNWNPTPEYNLFFLRAVQNHLNDRLKARGHVTLNDAYDELGLERTKAGFVVGWIYGGTGDNYVDFGVWTDNSMDRLHDFMTGREGEILLDFNVDGVIYDKLGK